MIQRATVMAKATSAFFWPLVHRPSLACSASTNSEVPSMVSDLRLVDELHHDPQHDEHDQHDRDGEDIHWKKGILTFAACRAWRCR